jgi:hypothetical protein
MAFDQSTERTSILMRPTCRPRNVSAVRPQRFGDIVLLELFEGTRPRHTKTFAI